MAETLRARPTRGKTAPNRLRRLDVYLCRREATLLRRREGDFADAVVADLGFGRAPWTTLELARRLRRVSPELRVVGVEVCAHRVLAALPACDRLTSFRLGGFELPLADHEPARLIRAMNVLRQYRPDQVPAAHRTLGRYLVEGGLLVEGTSSKLGRVLVANLSRRRDGELRRERLLFSTDFRSGFGPWMFRDRLPRDLRQAWRPGGSLHGLMRSWADCFEAVRDQARSPRETFVASVERLADRIDGVRYDPWLVSRGYFEWRWPGP
jgi:hypothetical protein